MVYIWKLTKVFVGCVLVGIGVILIHHAHLVTGGTAGLSLSCAYLFHVPFSIVFLLLNLPFFVLSLKTMGKSFTLSSILAIVLLSGVTYLNRWLPDFVVLPIVGSVLGGLIIGIGVVVLFLNGSSLGGATILALYLQRRLGWDPGKVNFAFDCCVVCTGTFIIGISHGLYSFLSVFILGAVISYFKQKIASQSVDVELKKAA